MTKDELITNIREMPIKELIELAPILKLIADSAEQLGKSLPDSSYNVVMKDCGEMKINVIRTLRYLSSDLGLREAKDMVESPTPVVLLRNLSTEQARHACKMLTEAGASVELTSC